MVDLGSYFVVCEGPTADDIAWWNGNKGYGGGPGLKPFKLYAEPEHLPRWPFAKGKGEPLLECMAESPGDAEAIFARALLELAAERLQEQARSPA
jgi:hypothetical protein